jgi:hypothetical protein
MPTWLYTRMPTSWGAFSKTLLVGDWPILCGRKQAFQGPPRTSQHIAACQSSTVKNYFCGPQSATRGRVGLVTLKTPRASLWCKRVSAEPMGRPVWSWAWDKVYIPRVKARSATKKLGWPYPCKWCWVTSVTPLMQGNANVNSVEPPLTPRKQRIKTTFQTQIMITTKRQFFHESKKQSGIPDTLTNMHV